MGLGRSGVWDVPNTLYEYSVAVAIRLATLPAARSRRGSNPDGVGWGSRCGVVCAMPLFLSVSNFRLRASLVRAAFFAGERWVVAFSTSCGSRTATAGSIALPAFSTKTLSVF